MNSSDKTEIGAEHHRRNINQRPQVHVGAKHITNMAHEQNQEEYSNLIQQLKNHPLLDKEQESVLALLIRRANTTRKLVELAHLGPEARKTPDGTDISAIMASIATNAAEGGSSNGKHETGQPDWPERCQEALPQTAEDGAPYPTDWEAWWNTIMLKGETASNTMATCNQRLVLSMATKYRWSGMEMEDLIQEGNLGLAEAIERYDERTGYRFTSYATWWIRNGLQKGVAKRGRTIRIPQKIMEKIIKIHAIKNRINAETGRDPTEQEMAQEMPEATPQEIMAMLDVYQDTFSLEQQYVDQRSEATGTAQSIQDRYFDQTTPGPEHRAIVSETQQDVRCALDKLGKRSRTIIERRYGIRTDPDARNGTPDDDIVPPQPATRQMIGKELGISGERVRQLENQALTDLKQHIPYEGLETYLESAGLSTI